MGNPSQLVQFAFAAGIDQSQRDEVLEPSSGFLNLENVRQNKRGGISKRNGFTYQTLSRLDATSRSAGHKLFAHGKQTCVIDGTTLDVYSTAASVNVNRGRVPECSLSMRSMPSTGLATSVAKDAALCGSYYAMLYTVGNDIWVSVCDTGSGAVVRPPEKIGTSQYIAGLAWYGTRVFAIAQDPSGGTITYRILNTASSSTINSGWSVAANVCSDAATLGSAVLSTCSLSDRVCVAYVNNSGGASQLTVKTLDSTGVLETATVNTGGVTPARVAVQGSITDTLWVCWNEAANVKVVGLDADVLASTLATAATVLTMAGAPLWVDVMSSSTAGAGRAFAFYSSNPTLKAQGFTTSAGAVTTSVGDAFTTYNTIVTGRVFSYGGRYYGLCSQYQVSSAIVCDLSGTDAYLRPVANILPGLVASPLSMLLAHAETSGTQVWIPVLRSTTQASTYVIQVAVLDFASSSRWQSVSFGGKTYLSGGLLSVYDGATVAEAGFVARPPQPTAADSGVPGSPNGSYRYAVVYEQVDKDGTWFASGVSDPSSSVNVASKKITVTVRPLAITSRLTGTTDPGGRITIYRTVAGGSPPYYFLTTLDNDLSSYEQSYTDNTSDTTLAANGKLYAPSLPGVNGGAQDRRAPPGLTCLTVYNGMMVGSQGEDLFWSGQDVAGEGTWFNPVFQVPVSGGGDITGLAAQDGTLFVFKRRAIYAVSGEAPSDNGAVGGLGNPRRLAVDVGCIDARSIVVTSLGVFFQSERGIELLTRAQSVAWIGEQVQDTIASYPVCSSATLDTTANVVYFELAASESSGLVSGNGRTLVYDLSMGQWASVDRRASYAGVADTPAQSAAMIWDGTTYRYAWLQTNGYVRPEQSTYLDSGSSDTWVTMLAETGWVKVGGIQGKQMFNKAMLLAKKSTRADIGLALAYDYDSTYKSATVTAANTIDTLNSSLARVQLGHDAHDDAEGQAVRLKVYDATPTGGTVSTGQGATWVALTFDVTPREGAAEVPDTAR